MAVASSSAWWLRVQLWHDMRRDLRAAGVPQEAFPQRLPTTYGIYTVRSPAGARIQVLVLRGAFLVCRPLGWSHTCVIDWEGNPAAAWERARLHAGW